MYIADRPPGSDFKPHPFLWNGHLMTILPGFLPRRQLQFMRAATRRLFEVEEGTQLLGWCHFHPVQPPATVIILHGLEGSSDSSYVLGVAEKAFSRGLNVVRLNMRNCGGTMHLTPTLYNGGLSCDVLSVVEELTAVDRVENIILVGFSLGGNIMLKAAGESSNPAVKAVAAISPAIDLEIAVTAIERPRNRIYEQWFLRSLKRKILAKSKLFPAEFDATGLARIKSIREFDDTYTAPHGGYGCAANYYHKASSVRVFNRIAVPSLIIAAHDDPIVPVEMFSAHRIENANIRVVITKHGGHAGFVQHKPEVDSDLDLFWAENRVIEFMRSFGF